jgi:hypothetical protein
LTHAELEEAVKCFHQGTKVFATTGMAIKKPMCIETNQIPPYEDCLSPVLLEQVNESCKIETLILEEHFINASVLTYKCFPSTTKHLSMEKSHLLNAPVKESYFFNMASHTTQLESLNLSGCSWFEDHSMMAISKCPKLKVLRLRNCPKVGTCAAYIFLSARFGFEAIEVLDLRETAVSDSEVRAFKSKPNLKRLYIDGRLHMFVFCYFCCNLIRKGTYLTFFSSFRKNDADEVDRVTDKGLNTPAEPAPYLEVLTLTNTQITDGTLNNLASNVPNLQLIDIRGTCVTEPGVAKLRSNCPTLKVVCDFSDWTTDLSTIQDDLWIDKDFFHQEEVKQPPILVPRQALVVDDGAGPLQNEQIEILPVQDGFVRLRRIVVYPQVAAGKL